MNCFLCFCFSFISIGIDAIHDAISSLAPPIDREGDQYLSYVIPKQKAYQVGLKIPKTQNM